MLPRVKCYKVLKCRKKKLITKLKDGSVGVAGSVAPVTVIWKPALIKNKIVTIGYWGTGKACYIYMSVDILLTKSQEAQTKKDQAKRQLDSQIRLWK